MQDETGSTNAAAAPAVQQGFFPAENSVAPGRGSNLRAVFGSYGTGPCVAC